METGDKSDMLTLPLCLGCGKPRTAALGAITSSSYYQATPCPSTKIVDLVFSWLSVKDWKRVWLFPVAFILLRGRLA